MGEARSFGPPYAPGLDGLRAVAVIVVIAFHLEVPGFEGGFLGVSLFFTLSGFLITQLLVGEHRATGRISLRNFWSRRFRRLMPAALVGLGAIALASIVFDLYAGARLRGDLASALGYAANWRFAFGSRSYSDLFAAGTSPVQHFWSLAIEEQFYFVFPVVVAVLLARRSRRTLPVALVAMLVAAVAAGLLTESRDLVYYGSHVRAAELLVGALLALMMPVGRSLGVRTSRLAVTSGTFAVAALAVLVATVTTEQSWLYDGGLAAFSVVSVALIVAVLVPGPWRALASWRPLVFVGRISYGLYVFHWPVIVAMSPERVPVSGWLLDVCRVAVTFVLALVSWSLIEQPVRHRRILVRFRPALAAAGGAFVAVTVAVVAVPSRVEPVLAGVAAPDSVVAFAAAGSDVDATRVVVIGSVAGVAERLRTTAPRGEVLDVIDLTQPQCAARASGGRRGDCRSIDDVLVAAAGDGDPDLVVLAVGAAERDLLARLVGDRPVTRRVEEGDPVVRSLGVTRGYAESLLRFSTEHAVLVWDDGPVDVLANELSEVDVRNENVVLLARPDDAALKSTWPVLIDRLSGSDDRLRLMVIGDSVSYGVAEALSVVAGGSFEVLWAGGRNCPLVDLVEVRWWESVEFDLTECPTIDGDWSRVADEFRPDAVVAIASVPEQSEQRYEADGEWFAVGDAEFERRHQDSGRRLVELSTRLGARLIVFSSPAIHGGAMGGAPFASDERVAAWNDFLSRFATQWPDRVTLLDWAAVVAEAEGDVPGSLRRDDGVHMLPVDLRRVVGERLVPLLTDALNGVAG